MTVNDLLSVTGKANINFTWFNEELSERSYPLYFNTKPLTKIEQFCLYFIQNFVNDYIIEITTDFCTMNVVVDRILPDTEIANMKERAYAKVITHDH